jgi:hypothetical protein
VSRTVVGFGEKVVPGGREEVSLQEEALVIILLLEDEIGTEVNAVPIDEPVVVELELAEVDLLPLRLNPVEVLSGGIIPLLVTAVDEVCGVPFDVSIVTDTELNESETVRKVEVPVPRAESEETNNEVDRLVPAVPPKKV